MISRAQGLKLVVETLMSSLKPIGNIVVICCAFFIIFGILGVQVCGNRGASCQQKPEEGLSSWPLDGEARAAATFILGRSKQGPSSRPRATGPFASWALCRKLEAWKRP